ncbi:MULTISPECIES: hypothetical protein [unclassified Tenacibaculum]|uniref:hypothetical protein n=1 Tax=unclassified Tenacibaculum TaxID=2635139 RepID=UPI001F2B72E2|nr:MULTISPECIES: hypothetical protein [unclassified Tenacibaculum]MCF2874317.1 hypothetical protein [Tenacibaculum sp. Cn5-1]MCF2934898.1 hypothetical protein [Tenacibaculum sp. Cn5-34]MCG7511108.1 hypothetical protein [Tenacibaculum sp. Cn5-46]
MKVLKVFLFVLILLVVVFVGYGLLIGDSDVYVKNKISFQPYLSSYNMYKGAPKNLEPKNGYYEYELTSPLFTDYAKKQRLIKLPNGEKLNSLGDDLPNFPDGTIIAKTFYYLNDELAPEKGKRVIETRVLEKKNDVWNVAVYLWNKEQTDAKLIEDGYETVVKWNDKNGVFRTINYQVPDNTACTTCHQIDKEVVPIGPKLRMLNRMVSIDGVEVNQLKHLQDIGMLHNVDPSKIAQTPNYLNTSIPIEERGRAYLDINCAHCHRTGGAATNYAFWLDLNLNNQVSFQESNIAENKEAILEQMETKKMPLIGTTIIDKEGVALIKEYVNALQ